MTGKLKDLTMNRDGTQNLTLVVDQDFRDAYDQLADQRLDITIKKHRNQRSLDANAYCWILIDKIAEATGVSKTEVYQNAIRDIGGVSEIICLKTEAVARFREIWSLRGLGWQTDTLPSKIPGCTNVVVYFGSSTYDTKQMSSLIEHLIQDAEGLGIPTMTPKKREELLAQLPAKK